MSTRTATADGSGGARLLLVLAVCLAQAVTASATAEQQTRFRSVFIGPAGKTTSRPATPATFHRARTSLLQLVGYGYDLTPARIVGAPEWADELSWEVTGEAAPGTNEVQVRDMVRSMLADRFRLRAKLENRSVSVLRLSLPDFVATQRLRSSQADVDCEPFFSGRRRPTEVPRDEQDIGMCGPATVRRTSEGAHVLHFRKAPLSSLARFLEITTGEIVVLDPSGAVDGLFDIDFEMPSTYRPAGPAPDIDSFMAPLREQLGAVAELRTMSVEVLVIEGCERADIDAK